MDFPKVLISIVNWMNYWDTIACISLCKEQLYENIKIIVIDNASKNESVEKIKTAHPDVLLVRNKKNKGFAGGHILSYKYAIEKNFDVLWLLNPDTQIFKDTLVNLVKAYKNNKLAIYGSVNVDIQGNNILPNTINGIDGFDVENNEFIIDSSLKKASYVNGSSFFISKEIMMKLGFFSTKYFMYNEEVDYCYVAMKNKIPSYYVLNSKIFHEKSKSFALSDKLQYVKDYYLTRNFIYFAIKNKIFSRKVICANNGGLNAVLKNVFQKKNLQLHYYALGVLHGCFGLRGKIVNPNNFL